MKKFLKWFWFLIPLILAVAMYFILPFFPEFTEYVFSRGLFKLVTVPLGFVTSIIPVSLTELLAVLAIPGAIFLIVLLIVKLKKSKSRKKTALKALRGVGCFVSCACLMYMICHGANFYRMPIEKTMALDTSQKTPEQLQQVCVTLVEGAKQARAEMGIGEDEPFSLPEDNFTELTRAGNGYDKLTGDYSFLWTSIFRQKPVFLSEPWSYTGITGMYFPFLAECNVNVAQADYAIPFTAAHESAHSRGIAFENECNFLAFLSCINSDFPEYRYSGYMLAYTYCGNALYAYDTDMWSVAAGQMTSGMWKDVAAQNDYIDSHKGKVMEVSKEVNDNFIKSQGVPEGKFSYNRVVELILAYYCQ